MRQKSDYAVCARSRKNSIVQKNQSIPALTNIILRFIGLCLFSPLYFFIINLMIAVDPTQIRRITVLGILHP